MSELEASEPDATEGRTVAISGYVTSDGVTHEFRGWVRLEGDEFVFLQLPRMFHPGEKEQAFRLPRTEVDYFLDKKTHVAKTILLSAGIVLVGIFTWLTIAATQFFK